MIDLEEIVSKAERLGASFVDARYQDRLYEYISIDNGVVREYNVHRLCGIGLRVVVDGYTGFASTNIVSRESIEKLIERAYSIARAMKDRGRKTGFVEKKVVRDKVTSSYRVDPFDIDSSEKIKLLMDAYKSGRSVEDVSSLTVVMGMERDHRVYASSYGDHVESIVHLIGYGVVAIASHAGVMERVYDGESMVAGWEFIEKSDLPKFSREVSELASKAVKAPTLKPGVYTAVLDNEMVGLMLHEAFGHATEGDIVESRDSILYGRIGEKVASEKVTIIDDGNVEGGYYVVYDDEGCLKKKVATVENGVLKTFLHSLSTAYSLGGEPTGNARAMNYSSPVLVRQTNTYMAPGDYRVEELFEDIDYGVYIRGRGALGGQVDTSMGTFTFTAGPSYIIEKGEPRQMVRGVMLSGSILETLKNVDAVARDLRVKTSVFGGCGKDGQMVRVGDGGPHVRVKRITIGSSR